MNHYHILRNDSRFLAVLINPQAYRFRAFSGTPSNDAVLAFDVNYSWGLVAIGHVRSEDQNWRTLPDKQAIRPCLCIRSNGAASIRKPTHPDFRVDSFSLVMQGGPTLVYAGKAVAASSLINEEFRADAVRRTEHVAVGCTRSNKIIALYGANASMDELASELISYSVLTAMKCDGGSRSFFQLNVPGRQIKLGSASSTRAGLQFEKKG
jgi:hypothetical protein